MDKNTLETLEECLRLLNLADTNVSDFKTHKWRKDCNACSQFIIALESHVDKVRKDLAEIIKLYKD